MAKRKASALDQEPRMVNGICCDGCIDSSGRVVRGFVYSSGTIWVERSELDRAERYGWKATDQVSGDLVAVKR